VTVGPEDGVIAARRQMGAEHQVTLAAYSHAIRERDDVQRQLAQALDELHECRQQRDRARMQARDGLNRLTRIAERHGDDGYGFCSLCRDGLGNQIDFSCEDYRDATGMQS
jgi:chromosome segregation ATPase